MTRVTGELLQHSFELSGRPQRVVSLLSAATETIDSLGLGAVASAMAIDLDTGVVKRLEARLSGGVVRFPDPPSAAVPTLVICSASP